MDDLTYREISNGIWFITNLIYLIFTLQFYADLRINTDRYQLTNRVRVEGIVLATALYFLAASTRSGYIWSLLLSENAELDSEEFIRSWGVIMAVAALLGVTAVLALMRFQSDKRWGARVWIAAALTIVSVPVVAHFTFNSDSREHVWMVLMYWWGTGTFDPTGFR